VAIEDPPNGKNARINWQINWGQSKNTLQSQNEKPTQKPISIYSDPIDPATIDPEGFGRANGYSEMKRPAINWSSKSLLNTY